MIRLNNIEEFFKDFNFNDRKIQISKSENVLDVKKFVESHISILKANKGNPVYMPYFTRLKKIYLLLKSEL